MVLWRTVVRGTSHHQSEAPGSVNDRPKCRQVARWHVIDQHDFFPSTSTVPQVAPVASAFVFSSNSCELR